MAQEAKKEKTEKESRAVTPTRVVERLPSVDRDIESVSRLFDRMFDDSGGGRSRVSGHRSVGSSPVASPSERLRSISMKKTIRL